MAFFNDLNETTILNDSYRKELYTVSGQGAFQLVIMSLLPEQDIGMEIHSDVTQFISIVSGIGILIFNGDKKLLTPGSAIVIPPNAEHNIINVSKTENLKLTSVYTPPEHPPKTHQIFK